MSFIKLVSVSFCDEFDLKFQAETMNADYDGHNPEQTDSEKLYRLQRKVTVF